MVSSAPAHALGGGPPKRSFHRAARTCPGWLRVGATDSEMKGRGGSLSGEATEDWETQAEAGLAGAAEAALLAAAIADVEASAAT